jgi:predicted HTH transcriptional regulator
MGTRNQKTKLRELVTTVVSFANTQGGHIYLGIDDECGLPGINQELQKWSKQDLSEESVNRYCGALTNCIRGKVIGDVYIFVSHASIDGVVIVVVNVSQSPAKPATVMGDNLFYVRAGANNKQLPPDQWESVLGVREGGIASSYNAN